MVRYGILVAAARLSNRCVYIWSDDNNSGTLKLEYKITHDPPNIPIHLLQTAGFTHFNLLESSKSVFFKLFKRMHLWQ